MSKLERGLYQIVSAKDYDGPGLTRIVGRYPIEDLSLLPKAVLNLPPGVRPHTPHWLVDITDSGNYILKALGAPVGPLKDVVKAFLIPEMAQEPLEWKITPVESTENPNDYIIQKVDDSGKGWVVGDGETPNGAVIAIKPLIAAPSNPPQYPPNQIFNFLRIDRE